MKKVRVGIIGCGAFARTEHLPNCKRNKRIRLVWCSSRSEENRRYAKENFSPEKLTADADEVFKARDVDMVILSVPHNVHEEMILKAAAHGKNILCEKPMAMSMDESYRIVKAVQKAGVKLCVD